jgi:hypothetical protein
VQHERSFSIARIPAPTTLTLPAGLTSLSSFPSSSKLAASRFAASKAVLAQRWRAFAADAPQQRLLPRTQARALLTQLLTQPSRCIQQLSSSVRAHACLSPPSIRQHFRSPQPRAVTAGKCTCYARYSANSSSTRSHSTQVCKALRIAMHSAAIILMARRPADLCCRMLLPHSTVEAIAQQVRSISYTPRTQIADERPGNIDHPAAAICTTGFRMSSHSIAQLPRSFISHRVAQPTAHQLR